jgi:hypothetical protein
LTRLLAIELTLESKPPGMGDAKDDSYYLHR